MDANAVAEIWRHTPPDYVVVTSGEGLRNLIEITPGEIRKRLFASQLVVISDRIRDLAISSGFTLVPRVAGDANDEGLFRTVIELAEETKK